MKCQSLIAIACAGFFSTAAIGATPEAAIKACAAEVLKELDGVSGRYRLDENSDTAGRLSNLQNFEIEVRSTTTDEVLARANCLVTRRAQVLRLNLQPVGNEDIANVQN